MLPFALFGMLTGSKWITTAARVLALVVAVFFMAVGIRSLASWPGRSGPAGSPLDTPGGEEVFSISEIDTLYIITVPGFEGDHGGELATDLPSIGFEPAVRAVMVDTADIAGSVSTVPILAAAVAPWWVDPRSEHPLDRQWMHDMAELLETRRNRVFAVQYEPYCLDRVRSLVDFLDRFGFRCHPDSGFTFLMAGTLQCQTSDCSTCPASTY